jgi:hypothetical protein
MNQREMTEIIATRELYLLGEDGKREPITVAVGRPQPRPNHFSFYCPYRISGAGTDQRFFAAGVDAIGALQNAMIMMGMELENLNRKLEGGLRWGAGEGGDLGFPSSAK